MPIYEYVCLSCENQFEKLVLNNSTEIICPKCNKKDVEKKFSTFASPGAGKKVSASGSSCSSCSSHNCSSCG